MTISTPLEGTSTKIMMTSTKIMMAFVKIMTTSTKTITTSASLLSLSATPQAFFVPKEHPPTPVQVKGVTAEVLIFSEHAKRLLMALQENVLKYEQAFGRIDLGTAEDQRMIPPITPTNGEA